MVQTRATPDGGCCAPGAMHCYEGKLRRAKDLMACIAPASFTHTHRSHGSGVTLRGPLLNHAQNLANSGFVRERPPHEKRILFDASDNGVLTYEHSFPSTKGHRPVPIDQLSSHSRRSR